MKDYQLLLNKFPDGFVSFFTGKEYPSIPEELINYLNKYWLDKKELDEKWAGILNSIFNVGLEYFPDNVFIEGFYTIINRGGSLFALFDRDDYSRLHSCITKTGDTYFVIVQDYDENDPPSNLPPDSGCFDWPPLRFKYPISASFDEIMSGEFVSEEMFLGSRRDYFIFGDSGQWGIYAGNDAPAPLHIIGFKNKFSELFNNHFKIPEWEKIL